MAKLKTGSIAGLYTATETGDVTGGGTGGGVTTYATLAELPLSNNDTGAMAFVEENSRLYIFTGTGWFNIALINTAPSITSGGAGSYQLATDGTPTVITMVAEDPEGIPITWSYSVTSGSLGNTATVAQDGNAFIITPSTNEADAGTFQLTFTASDGVNIATDVNSFTLLFAAKSQVWRIYANVASNYGLWDIHDAQGLYDGNGTRLAASLTFRSSGVVQPGEYSIFRGSGNPFTTDSSNGVVWDAGPEAMFDGGRTSWNMNVSDYIIFYLSSSLLLDDMSGGSLNLRTLSASRPTRCPRQMFLQYYDGVPGASYDANNWVTYATLNSNQQQGDPTWSNITEGSTITV